MRPRLYIALILAFVAYAAPASASTPQQCGTICQNPSDPRTKIVGEILSSLPSTGQRWSVYCTPSSQSMTCWARNPSARFVRRYTAWIAAGDHEVFADRPWSLRSLKTSSRGDVKLPSKP